MTGEPNNRDTLYAEACASLAPAISRLARSVERDADRSREVEQEMHVALWRSLSGFDGRCALTTWTYRVAHNVAASHVARAIHRPALVGLDEADALVADDNPEQAVGAAWTIARLHALIDRLKPADRAVILLYLEDLDAAAIGVVTGLSPGNVAVKIHRIKALLARHFASGDTA